MNYFWVNIGDTIDEVVEKNYLWAPLPYVNEKGRKINPSGWMQLDKVRAGDIFFCKNGPQFQYVAVVTRDVYKAERPDTREFDRWQLKGRRVDVALHQLEIPIDADAVALEFLANYYELCQPKVVSSKGEFCETYASHLPAEAGEYLLSQLCENRTGVLETSSEIINNNYLDYCYPHTSHSWSVLNENVACKTVDKTLLGESSTAIPLDIVSFFANAPLSIGQSVNLRLNINGKDYDTLLNRKPDGRHKLSLVNAKRKLKLSKLVIDKDTLWFERDNEERNQFYAYTKSIKNTGSVPPKPSRKSKPGKTTRKTNGEARVGQDYFKAAVTEVCNGRCVVTGVKDQVPSILIGSHTKSWIDSNDEERMDGHNGLLLAPHVDKLFDRYLISFSQSGHILVSDSLDNLVLSAWGIDTKKQYQLTTKQHEYMGFHRKKFEEKQ